MICLQLTLLFFLLQQGSSQEFDPVFRSVGSMVEMGYCFGEDYLVIYRVVREDVQLLGNSSVESPPVTPPFDFQGRISTNRNHQLHGLQIKNLTHRDSGTYRRECWNNQTLVKQHTQQLTVCDSELESHEIVVISEEGGVEIMCNSSALGQEGVSVQWYYDTFPTYTITRLLDTRISLDPVDGILEVKDNGAKLVLNKTMLSNNQHFYCLVHKDARCLSFQDLYLPESLESIDVFASQGDKVVLYCKADGSDQYWETPTGRVENADERSHHMFISTGEESQHYSLVIHAALDEHFGDYSCVSSMSEVQYSLVLCPEKQRSEVFTFENKDVTLRCDVGQVDSYMVQWYRRQASGQHELIYDSGDYSVPIPQDLRGRVKLWDEDSKLTILSVERADEELYWCVVIKGTVYLEDEEEYADEYEEEGDEEEGITLDWEDKCLFKQETFVSVGETFNITPEVPSSNNERGLIDIDPRILVTEPPQPKPNGESQTTAGVKLMIITFVAMSVL